MERVLLPLLEHLRRGKEKTDIGYWRLEHNEDFQSGRIIEDPDGSLGQDREWMS